MSQEPNIDANAYAHARFREVFGEPTNTLGAAEVWSLRLHPAAIDVHVLVNGAADQPAIWVFDPHETDNQSSKINPANVAEVEAAIEQVQQRVAKGSRGLGPKDQQAT